MRHVRNRDNSRWSFGVIDAAVLQAANPCSRWGAAGASVRRAPRRPVCLLTPFSPACLGSHWLETPVCAAPWGRRLSLDVTTRSPTRSLCSNKSSVRLRQLHPWNFES